MSFSNPWDISYTMFHISSSASLVAHWVHKKSWKVSYCARHCTCQYLCLSICLSILYVLSVSLYMSLFMYVSICHSVYVYIPLTFGHRPSTRFVRRVSHNNFIAERWDWFSVKNLMKNYPIITGDSITKIEIFFLFKIQTYCGANIQVPSIVNPS